MLRADRINSEKIYLVAGKRTPFGSFGGSLMNETPIDLATSCSKALLEEQKINPEKIDHVILGNVTPTTTDSLYGARHLALRLSAGDKTPAYSVNRLCGSGIQSILEAAQLIRMGSAQLVLAGGVEAMSNIPHLVYGSRFGTKYGPLKTVDMLMDSLTDQQAGCSMGVTAENIADRYSISRLECEEYSVKSHQKAAEAYRDKIFEGEVSPYQTKRKLVEKDEHFREDASVEGMQKLRASFKKEGTVTPATASGIVDGAASVLVASESFCQQNGLSPMAEIIDGSVVGVDPTVMGIGPIPCVKEILESNQLSVKDIDLFEINEAFAPQVMACQRELEIDPERLNIWGGAIALGHPLGATGTRISLTLARQLKSENKKLGIATACIGGGQGIGLLLKNVE
jgi:acetyl-CoA C-acetyltransferase/acetyl-CoA acyltransferase 2